MQQRARVWSCRRWVRRRVWGAGDGVGEQGQQQRETGQPQQLLLVLVLVLVLVAVAGLPTAVPGGVWRVTREASNSPCQAMGRRRWRRQLRQEKLPSTRGRMAVRMGRGGSCSRGEGECGRRALPARGGRCRRAAVDAAEGRDVGGCGRARGARARGRWRIWWARWAGRGRDVGWGGLAGRGVWCLRAS